MRFESMLRHSYINLLIAGCGGDVCPVNDTACDGACLASGIVYRADVTTTSGDKKIYIGMTEHTFKTPYNHKLSFNHSKHSHDTVLSKYIWDQKDNGTSYTIKWSIIKRANPYHGNSSRCNLRSSASYLLTNLPSSINVLS